MSNISSTRCHGDIFIEPLPSNNREIFTKPLPGNNRIPTDTDLWEGFIKYDVEMGSGAMIHIPSFIMTGSAIQRLRGGCTGTIETA
jgi:hypothetical protein